MSCCQFIVLLEEQAEASMWLQAGVADLPLFGCITRGLQFLFVARRGTTGASQQAVLQRIAVPPRYCCSDFDCSASQMW